MVRQAARSLGGVVLLQARQGNCSRTHGCPPEGNLREVEGKA